MPMAESKDTELSRDVLRGLLARPSSSSSSARPDEKKTVPKMLADELKGSKYKPRCASNVSTSSQLGKAFDDTVGKSERENLN